ncbi:hypothetical protein B0H14DRAFT_3859049 [Mycena olivaceomarginata]|nr:hypothetical protein B0H14DRAFT_3906212 [Mycena olivaceomarginata]KAJ7809474.1 hypothetical protein B0H14DRAFT_3880997 [Mycena olivaceomarginata]KAJ7877121.1 hypothetical protein B0H14DRAFT_3859049 [Mycena olivaceomarginata]
MLYTEIDRFPSGFRQICRRGRRRRRGLRCRRCLSACVAFVNHGASSCRLELFAHPCADKMICPRRAASRRHSESRAGL